MSITANRLRAGMYLIVDVAYIRVERIEPGRDGMITAFIRNVAGVLAPVRFHRDEPLMAAV